jgi:hypothetical protein
MPNHIWDDDSPRTIKKWEKKVRLPTGDQIDAQGSHPKLPELPKTISGNST